MKNIYKRIFEHNNIIERKKKVDLFCEILVSYDNTSEEESFKNRVVAHLVATLCVCVYIVFTEWSNRFHMSLTTRES